MFRCPPGATVRSVWPVCPALCPVPGRPFRISLGLAAFLDPLRRRQPPTALVRRLLRYYQPVRLPAVVHHGRAPFGFSARTVPRARPTAGPPGFRATCFDACMGSTTTRGPGAPRDGGAPGIAFRVRERRRHPGCSSFAARYPARTFPCQRLPCGLATAQP